MSTPKARWLRFNLVGVMGFALQTATLSLLVRWAGVGATIAVTIAVAAAVSHNFIWHELFTWPDRPRETRLKRWLSFHLSTGAISILSNVVVTIAVVNTTGLPVVAANIVAVAVASIANFWVSDRLVFRP